MIGRRLFPFGARPIFNGYVMLVLGRVDRCWFTEELSSFIFQAPRVCWEQSVQVLIGRATPFWTPVFRGNSRGISHDTLMLLQVMASPCRGQRFQPMFGWSVFRAECTCTENQRAKSGCVFFIDPSEMATTSCCKKMLPQMLGTFLFSLNVLQTPIACCL